MKKILFIQNINKGDKTYHILKMYGNISRYNYDTTKKEKVNEDFGRGCCTRFLDEEEYDYLVANGVVEYD